MSLSYTKSMSLYLFPTGDKYVLIESYRDFGMTNLFSFKGCERTKRKKKASVSRLLLHSLQAQGFDNIFLL